MADFIHIGNLKRGNALDIANLLDSNQDGQLSRDEFSVFDEKAATLGLKDGQIKRAKKQMESLFNATNPGEAPQTRRERNAERMEAARRDVFDLAENLKGEGQYTDNIMFAVNNAYRDENGAAIDRFHRRALNELQDAAEAEVRATVINPVIDDHRNTSTGTGSNSRTEDGHDVADDGLTKGRHIKRATKQGLKDSGAWDSQLVRDAFRDGNGREALLGDDTIVTDRCAYQAAANRTEQRNVQTDAEIMENFGGRIDILNTMMDKEVVEYDQMGKLTGNNIKLIYKDEQDNWHLDGLQQEIQNYIGADLELNRDSKIHASVAELTNLHGRLKTLTGDNTLTKHDVKAIVEGCGFDIEPKAWQDFLGGTLVGAVLGAGAGLASAQRGYDIIPVVNTEVISNLKLIFKDETFEGGITTQVLIEKLGSAIPVAGNVLTSTLVGTLAPIALAVLEGIEDDGQVPTIDTTLSEEHKQNREAYLSSLDNHPYKAAIELLTLAFKKEDGSWDAESYETFLGRLSGDGDPVLNRNELEAGLRAIKTDKIEKTPDATSSSPIAQTIEVTSETIKGSAEQPIEHVWNWKHSWPAVVYAYYPEAFTEASSWGEIMSFVNEFRKVHGIRKSDGTPVGQTSQLKSITVNGKEYKPQACTETTMQDAINKFGWNSRFFRSDWEIPVTTSATLVVVPVQEYERTVYQGRLIGSDGNVIVSIENQETAQAAVDALKLNAGSTESTTNLTIRFPNENGEIETTIETLPKKNN